MKITMYELLGMVKDGKAPKKIKLNEVIFEYQGDDYLYKDEDKKEHWLFSSGYTDKYTWLENFLKAEVEILEEPKGIPEKLITWFSVEEDQSLEQNVFYVNYNIQTICEKINKILDYLESKGDD